MPVQQSFAFEQTSPGCTQNDESSTQVPAALQSPEQHWPLVEHAFPAVSHVVFNGAHAAGPPSTPAAHVPLQHWASVVHAMWSDVHWTALHWKPTQLRLQQSVPTAHAAAAGEHEAVFAAQVCVAESHAPEQQSLPAAQIWPNVAHAGEAPSPPAPS
jgi:hypothetical protein